MDKTMNEKKLEDFLIKGNEKIKTAIQKINENCLGTVLVMDEKDEEKVIGVVNDGDIRRSLVPGMNTNDAISTIMNTNFKFANNICDAMNLAKTYRLRLIPVLDDEGKLKIIVNQNFILSTKKLNCPVVIQAGGLGTRLYPYTKILPKPLIPVGDYPIIELIMKRFVDFGCTEFFIIVNHKKEMIKSYFSEIENKYKITFVDETTPLGTAGGLSLMKGMIDKPFILANCDTFLDCDFSECYDQHLKSQDEITMISANINFKIPYGTIVVDENKEILELKEKPQFDILTNVGVYVVNPRIIEEMEENKKIHMTEVCEKYMKERKCGTFIIQENEWNDMGELDKLNKMMEK